MFAVSVLSVVPLRAEASDSSEMVSQVLFGECLSILERQEKWSKIRCAWDDYEGWIDNKRYLVISAEQFECYTQATSYLRCPYHAASGVHRQLLSIGSPLPQYHDGEFTIGEEKWHLADQAVGTHPMHIPEMLQYAQQLLRVPYLWGGRSAFGIDCSGFSQIMYRLLGVALPRDAKDQVQKGEAINFEDRQSGDLAFFQNEQGRVVHVGIVLNHHQIIHSSGEVRIDQLKAEGIYNEHTHSFTHQFHSLRRYTSTSSK